MKICNVTIKLYDDFGNNPCTFHCALTEGHAGDHQETGELDGQAFNMTWQGTPMDV